MDYKDLRSIQETYNAMYTEGKKTKEENVHVDMVAHVLDEQGAPYKDLKSIFLI